MIRAGSRLFRNAIFIPGWNHGWDNIIKDVVRRWSWWPSFIAGLKACTRFFRVAAYRIAIAVHLRGELSAATLAVLANFGASFAKWRWQTLHRCLIGMLKLEFLRPHWRRLYIALFRDSSKDPVEREAVNKEFSDAGFWRKLRVVHRISAWNEGARKWGGGCACHEQELLDGKTVVCDQKGRRLPEVADYIDKTIDTSMMKTRTWHLQEFEGDEELHMQTMSGVRYWCAMVRAKFTWPFKIPYLFCRATDPKVAEECLRQYDAIPADQHHNVSVHFAGTHAGSLRTALVACAQGLGASRELQDETNAIASGRIAEDELEGAHRDISREATRACGGSIPWLSATSSLHQSFELYDDLKNHPNFERCFRSEWANFKKVLQPPGRHECRPVRSTYKAFVRRVYRLQLHAHEEWFSCLGNCHRYSL